MLRLVVVLCLGTFAAANIGDDVKPTRIISHCCSASDRAVVQDQWVKLWKDVMSPKVRIGFGKLLITRLAMMYNLTIVTDKLSLNY